VGCRRHKGGTYRGGHSLPGVVILKSCSSAGRDRAGTWAARWRHSVPWGRPLPPSRGVGARTTPLRIRQTKGGIVLRGGEPPQAKRGGEARDAMAAREDWDRAGRPRGASGPNLAFLLRISRGFRGRSIAASQRDRTDRSGRNSGCAPTGRPARLTGSQRRNSRSAAGQRTSPAVLTLRAAIRWRTRAFGRLCRMERFRRGSLERIGSASGHA
jgi:hypothetical protein